MPDRIEAGTFALSVMGCSGKIVLENINDLVSTHLKSIFKPLNLLSLKKKDNGKTLIVKKLQRKV